MYDWNALGVRTLHSVLRKNNVDVSSIFFKLANPNNTMNPASSQDIDALIRLLKDLQPRIIAFSLRSSLFQLATQITKRIKNELGILTLWGGIHPTIRPQQSLEYADMVCIGEGEDTLIELCRRLSSGLNYHSIGNLWVRDNSNSLIKNKLYSLLDNLDSLPFADFSNENKYLIEHGKLLILPKPEDRAEYDIMTSRGCPFSCTYCCNSTYRKIYQGLGRYVRRRSVDNVVTELQEAKEKFKNLSYVYFYDDVFTKDKEWLADFTQKYRDLIKLPFFCYAHPNYADEDTLLLLKRAGLRDVTMGIQSGSKFIRDTFFKRPSSNAKIIEVSRIFRRHKINASYDILLDNPFEKETDRGETLQLLLQLPRPFQLHTHALTYFPETELTALALEKKYIKESDVEDQKQQSLVRWTATLDFSRDKENIFWDSLYYMAKKSYFPKVLIVKLSKNNFLREHPKILAFILKTFTYDVHSASTGRFKIFYLVFNGFKMILNGELSRFKSHFQMYLKRSFG